MFRQSAHKREKGTTGVELANVLPQVLLLLLGIMAFGVLMAHQLTFMQAA